MLNPTNLAEVQQFVKYVVFDLDVNFHPDTDFNDYTNSSGLPCFDKQNADSLNSVLAQAFIICGANGTDIYEVSLPMLQARVFV